MYIVLGKMVIGVKDKDTKESGCLAVARDGDESTSTKLLPQIKGNFIFIWIYISKDHTDL